LNIYIYYSFFFLFQLCFIIQLYYLLVIQKKFSSYKSPPEDLATSTFPISVIICARNEATNLKQYLSSILNQNYTNFEIIVVNDCSSDTSDDVLRVFQKEHPQLKVVKIDEHPRYKTAKKFAVTLGIKAASHEVLVFTDADCKPESNDWLRLIAANYSDPAVEIVLAYSPYLKMKGFLNKLIRYETFQTALNYFSFALNGMPYMGVGRNLSYKKSLFFKGKGFASHMHIPSGDDDLFVNQNATIQNIALEMRSDSHIWSEPKLTWRAYWKQKLRHLGAGKEYKKQHQFNLSLQVLSAISFYILLVVCLSLKVETLAVLIIFVLRLIAQVYVFYKPMVALKTKDLLAWFIIIDPFYYIYLLAIVIIGSFRKKATWK
jgi:biofilm PGA synthesis N-glycosyltransferase PgaC